MTSHTHLRTYSPAPIVAAGAGPLLSDRTLQDLVDTWVEEIDRAFIDDLIRTKAFLRSPSGVMPGNELDAEKWASSFRATYGGSLLATFRTQFQRDVGSFYFDVVAREELELPMPRLWACRWKFSSNGPDEKRTVKPLGEVASVDKKAVADLIRLGAVRRSEDLVDVISSAWREIATLSSLTADRRSRRAGDTWLCPVSVEPSPIVAILRGPTEYEDPNLFRVTQIDLRTSLPIATASKVIELEHQLSADPTKVFGVIDEAPNELVFAVEAVRNIGGSP